MSWVSVLDLFALITQHKPLVKKQPGLFNTAGPLPLEVTAQMAHTCWHVSLKGPT